MSISISVRTFARPNDIQNACSAAEKILAVQMMKDTAPFVPAKTKAFSNATRVVGKSIIYSGVQANYLYRGFVRVNAKTGKGPAYIPGVGYRYRKGTITKETDRKLNYTKSVNPKATDHWPEKSFEANKEKWERVIRKAVRDYGR